MPRTQAYLSADCVISHLAFFFFYRHARIRSHLSLQPNPRGHSHAGFMGNACRLINPWSCGLCFPASPPHSLDCSTTIKPVPVLLRTLTLPSITQLSRIRTRPWALVRHTAARCLANFNCWRVAAECNAVQEHARLAATPRSASIPAETEQVSDNWHSCQAPRCLFQQNVSYSYHQHQVYGLDSVVILSLYPKGPQVQSHGAFASNN